MRLKTKDCFMIKSLFALALVLHFSHSQAAIKIEEELYVLERPEILKDIISSGSIEIDHVTSKGFEVYGPKGLASYLEDRGIPFYDMKEISKSVFSTYPSYEENTQKLQDYAKKYSKIMKLFSIGKSVKGKELWVMKISNNPEVDQIKPEFKYISSMHGDEITGRELTIRFIEEVGEKYGKDSEITNLVNNTEIFIMPSMNPDGSERKQRGNANGIDLNRNFPQLGSSDGASMSGRQIEVQHVMKFQAERKFALSANFHGGTVVANYPWDSTYDRHPQDAFVQELSLVYADLSPEMKHSREFAGGITNGADWYVVRGGMQDWSSYFYNDLQITLEVSHQKWPSYNEIPNFYRDNRLSMIAFMNQVHRGAGFKFKRADVSGVVEVLQTSPVAKSLGSFAFNGSEFYKVMPEGEYTFKIKEGTKRVKSIKVQVEKDFINPNGNYLVIN